MRCNRKAWDEFWDGIKDFSLDMEQTCRLCMCMKNGELPENVANNSDNMLNIKFSYDEFGIDMDRDRFYYRDFGTYSTCVLGRDIDPETGKEREEVSVYLGIAKPNDHFVYENRSRYTNTLK